MLVLMVIVFLLILENTCFSCERLPCWRGYRMQFYIRFTIGTESWAKLSWSFGSIACVVDQPIAETTGLLHLFLKNFTLSESTYFINLLLISIWWCWRLFDRKDNGRPNGGGKPTKRDYERLSIEETKWGITKSDSQSYHEYRNLFVLIF